MKYFRAPRVLHELRAAATTVLQTQLDELAVAWIHARARPGGLRLDVALPLLEQLGELLDAKVELKDWPAP